MKWLIGLGCVLAVAAGAFWYFLLDANAPARADGTFDLAAYRALVAADAPETLPSVAALFAEDQARTAPKNRTFFLLPDSFKYRGAYSVKDKDQCGNAH